MHLTTALALLAALAVASPINSPRNADSAPAAAINKRFQASVPWIWRPRKTDFEQFEDDGTETTPTETNNKVKRFEASVPWIWRPRKTDFEQFEDDNKAGSTDEAGDNAVTENNKKVKRFEASVPWIWRPKKVDFEQFEDGATDAAGEGEGEQK